MSWLLGLGTAMALVVAGWLWDQGRHQRALATLDDWSTGCLACGAKEVRSLAPGVFECEICSYRGGPGLSAWRWRQRVQELASLSEDERQARTRRLARDARRVASAAAADLAAVRQALSRRNENQSHAAAEQLTDVSGELSQALRWLEEARHLRHGTGPLPPVEGTLHLSQRAQLADAEDLLQEVLRLLALVEQGGERSLQDWLDEVHDPSIAPLERAEALTRVAGQVQDHAWGDVVLQALQGPPALASQALRLLDERRVELPLAEVIGGASGAGVASLARALVYQTPGERLDEAISVALSHRSAEVQLEGARAAALLGRASLVPLLVPLSQRGDSMGEAARAALARLARGEVALMGAVTVVDPGSTGALSLPEARQAEPESGS